MLSNSCAKERRSRVKVEGIGGGSSIEPVSRPVRHGQFGTVSGAKYG